MGRRDRDDRPNRYSKRYGEKEDRRRDDDSERDGRRREDRHSRHPETSEPGRSSVVPTSRYSRRAAGTRDEEPSSSRHRGNSMEKRRGRRSRSGSHSDSAEANQRLRRRFDDMPPEEMWVKSSGPTAGSSSEKDLRGGRTASKPKVEYDNPPPQPYAGYAPGPGYTAPYYYHAPQQGWGWNPMPYPLPPAPVTDFSPPPPPKVDPNDPVSVEFAKALRRARFLVMKDKGETDTEEYAKLLEEQEKEEELRQAGRVPRSTAPAEDSTLPSVEDFVPVNPFDASDGVGPSTAAGDPTQMDGERDVMSLIPYPKINPQVERRAREARRAHISGFPLHTTVAELRNFFVALLPKLRRQLTIRERLELAEHTDVLNEEECERLKVPPNVQSSNIDVIKDLIISTAKSKKFAFIELNLADLVTELVELSGDAFEQKSGGSELLVFQDPQQDRRPYPLTIRRPRDYHTLDGVDQTKVVMTGFPSTLQESMLQMAFEEFGTVVKYEMNGEFAYAEYLDEVSALRCRAGLHGIVFASRMVVVLPLYDWLKVVCTQSGIDVTIDETDPISGKMVLETIVAEKELAEQQQNLSTAEGVLALIKEKPQNSNDLMLLLVDMTGTLHDAVFRLSAFYPHLRPLYNNTQVVLYPTRVLGLLNLFDDSELMMDDSYAALRGAIEDEVERYGLVEDIIIPRRVPPPVRLRPPSSNRADFESDGAFEDAQQAYAAAKEQFRLDWDDYAKRLQDPIHGKDSIGNAYVVYHTVEQAQLAQQAIAGKLFDGRTVVTSFLFEDLVLEMPPEEAEEPADETEKDRAMNDVHPTTNATLDEDLRDLD